MRIRRGGAIALTCDIAANRSASGGDARGRHHAQAACRPARPPTASSRFSAEHTSQDASQCAQPEPEIARLGRGIERHRRCRPRAACRSRRPRIRPSCPVRSATRSPAANPAARSPPANRRAMSQSVPYVSDALSAGPGQPDRRVRPAVDRRFATSSRGHDDEVTCRACARRKRRRCCTESRLTGTISSSATLMPYFSSRKHDQLEHAGRVDDAFLESESSSASRGLVVGEEVVPRMNCLISILRTLVHTSCH